MDAEFWHDRWAAGQIGFHLDDVNPMLRRHLGALSLPPGGRVFVPLCGKTRDIGWLLAQGYPVVGAELSQMAVHALFDELGVAPDVMAAGELSRFAAPGVEIYAGDIFDLSDIGPVAAVYDRAALIALPDEMRARYARHLRRLAPDVAQLLITVEYDQTVMPGPPFSVSHTDILRAHGKDITLRELERGAVPGGLKGQIEAVEVAWLLG